MPRTIYVQELGRAFSFPDGTSDEAVSSFFQQNFPAPPPVAPPVETPPQATGPDESGILGRFAYGFGTGLTDIPGGIASLIYPAEEAAKTSAGQFSEEARKYLQETFGIDPTKDPTAAQQLAGALGSVASFLVPGSAAAKGASLAGKTAAAAGRIGTVTAGAQGVALGAEQRSEKIRDQLASGMEISEEQQLASQRMSGFIGAAEAYPLGKFFGPITQLLSKVPLSQAPALNKIVQSRLGRVTRAGLEEGAQEAASGIANDIMEYGIYNPNVQIGQDILSNAGTGAFAGSFVEGLIQLAAGRKLRPYQELQKDLIQESRENVEKVRQGQISQAAENLRQTGLEGTIDIEQDEFDGLPVFNIKTPGGETIATFDDQDGRAEDTAIAAVNLYAKNTGVKVRPNVIKKEPEAVSGSEEPEAEDLVKDPSIVVPPTPKISPTPIETQPQAIAEEMPIGAVELPIEEQRYIEEAVSPAETAEVQPEGGRIEMRPSATPEQLADLQTELFGGPLNVREMTPEQLSLYEAERDKRFPPTPETVYYSAGPALGAKATVKPIAADVTPKSLGEAYALGPRVKALTPEVSQKFRKIYTDLNSRLSAIAPQEVTLGLREFIQSENPDLLIKGFHDNTTSGGQTKNIIDLATGIYSPDLTTDELLKNLLDVLNHEVIHALRRNGLLRPAEWRILSRAVGDTNVPGKKYTYLDKAQAVYTEKVSKVYADPDAVVEEAVAEMYKDWVRLGKAPIQTRGLLNRITEFFRRIFRVLRDNNYQEVFEAIETGEVSAREGVVREEDTRLSASSMPPESNAQKTQISGTFPTYKKASEILNKEKPDGKQLDFGAGLGMSQQLGFDTFEPYPRSGFTPTYDDSGNIKSNSYEKIVNLNVLNVVPIETRSKIVKEIGRILSPGGVAIITTRGRDVMSAKGTPGPEPMSVITSANTYQKGFTSPELVEYVSRELGEGFVVERLNLGPAGVIIRKAGDSVSEATRFSAAPALNTEEFARWFRNSKVRNPDGTPKIVYHGTQGKFKAFDTSQSELGSHFGTTNQANEFVQTPESQMSREDWAEDVKFTGRSDQIFPVYLSMQNPLRMKDTGRWIPSRVAKRLHLEGLITLEESKAISALPLNTPTQIKALQDLFKSRGIDGIVYLNRYEGFKPKTNPTEFALDAEQLSDADFKAKYPEAEDSYLIFDPVQVKSVFNEFEEGASTSPRFSAAPLPTYIQSQNQNMFTSPPEMTFSEKIFNYLFGYKPLDKERMRAAVRANIVDKTAFVTLLEKKLNQRDTGNFERRVADFSATAALTQRRRASQLTASAIMMGHPSVNFANPGDILSATVRIDESPDSLMRIFEILMKDGPVDPVTGKKGNLLDTFKTYAVAIRGRDLRAQGKPVPREITPQYINEALSFIPREYPQVVEAYNMYQRFNKNLLTAARDAGLISTAELGRLTRDMNYYGFYREVFQEELVPTSSTKTAGEFKLREYKGSEAGGLINDPMFVMIRNTQFWMESIAKNLASVKSYDVAQRMGEAQLLGRGQSPDLSQGFQKDIMYFKKDGVLKRFAVKDPLLVTALGSDDRVVLGKAIDILGMPASIIRETVTRDPAFMVANLLRDTVSSWITSGEDIKPFIGTAKGMVGAIKKSASFKDLMGYGVVGSYDMAMMEPADIASTIRRRTMPKNIHTMASAEGAIGAIQSLWDRLGALSEASDAATRIAVYEAARAQGLSEAEAAMRAVEIMDFSRRGASHLLNILTKTVPFLNARIQGLDVLYQSAAAGKRFVMGQSLGERDSNLGKKFLVRGLMLAALSFALEAINDDDEDYEQLDSYIKDGNLLIPLKVFGLPGEYIAIPKPFEAGLLFSTFSQMIYKYFVSGDASNRDVAKLFFSQFASTFGVNPLPQVLIPPLEIMTNHDFYTGLPLISEGKLRLDPSLQYDSRTSTIAMMISEIPFIYDVNTGEFRGPSPIAVDQLISGYAGPVGSYIAMALGAAMSGFDAGPERMPMEISQAPVIRRFFVDAEAKNPAVVTQAYELFRVVDEANRTFSRLRQANDAEALLDYFEEKKDVLAYKKYIYKLVDRLNKISAYERQIERDETMTDDEKIEARRNLRELRIRVASQVEEINKRLGR